MSKETSKKEASKKEGGFGIEDMAKYLDVTPTSARDKLRRAGLTPDGGKWWWSTKAKLEADGKKVKGHNTKKVVKPAAKKAKVAKEKAAA